MKKLVSIVLALMLGLPGCIRERTIRRGVRFALPVWISVCAVSLMDAV